MKKKKTVQPYMPIERRETIRQRIISLLNGRVLSAHELSVETHTTEREIYDHLEHIQRTMNKKELTLDVNPAACKRCGFVFRKRDKLKKPSKCPVCRSESIQEPLFSILERK